MTSCWDAVRDQQQQRRQQLVCTNSALFKGAVMQAVPPGISVKLPGDTAARIPTAISSDCSHRALNFVGDGRLQLRQATLDPVTTLGGPVVHPFVARTRVDYVSSSFGPPPRSALCDVLRLCDAGGQRGAGA
ncbi:hypothetical protein HPB50_028559 [Hyalomma asiaticum]|nr:hypothetical protein HPB50_028559 [Hyalomma asiaticum]